MPSSLDLWNQLAGSELTSNQQDRLSRFLDLLMIANQTMNLTRITDRAAAEIQHIGDSLTLLPPTSQKNATKLADVGSGGGVPGLVLAIVRPDIRVTLIEGDEQKSGVPQKDVRRIGARQCPSRSTARRRSRARWIAPII